MSRYQTYNGSYGDVSIRAELSKVLVGSPQNGEYARGRPLLFRRMKRDANGHPLLCPQCRKQGELGIALGHPCSSCWGMGLLWREEWVVAYSWSGQSGAGGRTSRKMIVEQGTISTDTEVFYLEYLVAPTLVDKLIEVALDVEGNPITSSNPSRVRAYDIKDVDHYRLDHGRSEYWRIVAVPVTVGWIGQPLASMRQPESL